jgi:thiol-disulfide isomerase/thioredoxin
MKSATFRLIAAVLLSLSTVAVSEAKMVPPTPAPAWKLKDVDGNLVTMAQFKGKVVILDFWATWCPPCRTEIPGYIALQKKYGADGLVIVGVSVDTDGVVPVKKFIKDIGINYIVVMADDDIQDAYGPFGGYPTTFIIDRDGKIRDKKLGREKASVFEADLLSVLKAP